MDADSTSRRHSHEDILSAFRRGDADILIGTQMIVKGLDFPNVTLVGALNADSSLNMPDFRAAERTYQLLAQVSGRAGRAELPGEVFIQGRDTSLPVFGHAARGDFVRFAEEELKERERCRMPPFCRLSAIGMSSADSKLVSGWSQMYAESLRRYAKSAAGLGMLVSDAMPAALEVVAGRYRWQIVLRAPSNATIVAAWKWILALRPPPKKLRVSLDIDAFDLI
jgi:primosomal protein N' (replication factor Y)